MFIVFVSHVNSSQCCTFARLWYSQLPLLVQGLLQYLSLLGLPHSNILYQSFPPIVLWLAHHSAFTLAETEPFRFSEQRKLEVKHYVFWWKAWKGAGGGEPTLRRGPKNLSAHLQPLLRGGGCDILSSGRVTVETGGEWERMCRAHHYVEDECLVLKVMEVTWTKTLKGDMKHFFWSAH